MRALLAVGRALMYEIGGKVSGASEGADAAIWINVNKFDRQDAERKVGRMRNRCGSSYLAIYQSPSFTLQIGSGRSLEKIALGCLKSGLEDLKTFSVLKTWTWRHISLASR